VKGPISCLAARFIFKSIHISIRCTSGACMMGREVTIHTTTIVPIQARKYVVD
jgi:hypothetical protein